MIPSKVGTLFGKQRNWRKACGIVKKPSKNWQKIIYKIHQSL